MAAPGDSGTPSDGAPGGGPTPKWFVATDGSDANPCTQASPCLTMNRAYRVAQPGDLVRVTPGTYPAQLLGHDAAKDGATEHVAFDATGASVPGLESDGAQHVTL